MSASSIFRKHRTAALIGGALIVAPLAALPMLGAPYARAQSTADSGASAAAHGSFAAIVSADKPAVVTITTITKAQSQSSDEISPFSGNSQFDEFFRRFFGEQGIPLPKPQSPAPRTQTLGSGFIIGSDGTIVTNNHVIDGATSMTVTLDDGTELPATLVGTDSKTDLAVVRVKPAKPLATIGWGVSDKLMPGDQVLAFGNPFGIGTTVTAGIVSARGRDLHSGPYDDFIQIDAPINRGNSGGPLVDVNGKVVGINTAIYSPNGGSVGVGFAIPSDQAQKVIAKLIESGSIEHGYLGVQIQPVTQDVADAIGLAQAEGALVAHVNDGSPAARAGIETGDVITAFARQAIKNPRDLSRIVADVSPNTKETLTVWRKGRSVDIPVTVGAGSEEQKSAAGNDSGANGQSGNAGLTVPAIGLGLSDITPDVRQAMNLPGEERGALVGSVDPDKPAAAAGIQTGDIIVSVNQVPVKNAKDAGKAIADAGKSGKKSVLLLVERDKTQTFVAVPFEKS